MILEVIVRSIHSAIHSGISRGLCSLSYSHPSLSLSPKGPMPTLKSKVALGWPDHTYLFEGRDEEDQEWVFVYHSLCNSRDTHMVAPDGGPDHQVH